MASLLGIGCRKCGLVRELAEPQFDRGCPDPSCDAEPDGADFMAHTDNSIRSPDGTWHLSSALLKMAKGK